MATQSLSDLRRLFFGGGSAAEYAFLSQANAAGVNAAALLQPELAYAEINAPYNPGSGVLADVTGLTISPVVPANGILYLEVFGFHYDTGAAGTASTFITSGDNATLYGLATFTPQSIANQQNLCIIKRKLTGLVAGSTMTFKVRGTAAVGNYVFNPSAGNGGRGFIRATRF